MRLIAILAIVFFVVILAGCAEGAANTVVPISPNFGEVDVKPTNVVTNPAVPISPNFGEVGVEHTNAVTNPAVHISPNFGEVGVEHTNAVTNPAVPISPNFGEVSVAQIKSSGEPIVSYYSPSGYAPATGGPLTIKKVVTAVEAGKGYGNRLRVDVEITSIKKNKNDDEIKDIDIYELADESLNIVPPADNIDEVSREVYPEELKKLSSEETHESFSDMPLINFKKLSSLEDIGLHELDLLRDRPLISVDPDISKKVYASPEMETEVKYYPPKIINYNVFYWDKIKGIDANNSERIKNIMNLSKYLKNNFGIKWVDPQAKISYPPYNGSKKEAINITDENESNEWIRIEIDDPDRDDGIALLNISGQMTYYLKFDTDKTNKNIWRVSDWNGIMRFHVKSLDSKDRLFYWYYVRPKKSGAFNTESIIRINDEDYSGWPDIIKPLNIKVDDPDLRFEVVPILEDSKVFVDPPWLDTSMWGWMIPTKWIRLNLKYLITYTGSASTTYLDEIEVEMKPSDSCRCYDKSRPLIDKNNLTTIENFRKDNTIFLDRQISYNSSGTYQIPAIWIEGSPHIFKDTVTVDNPVLRWYDIFNSYYTIITALLIILVNKELKGILTPILRGVYSLFIMVIRWFKIIFISITSYLVLIEKDTDSKEAEFNSKNAWQWSDSNQNSK
ncbi:MAG: hypothetical protein NTU95_09550 [Methanothrix sp.]|nr:hypothetical protein [Methanothrix sp.]